MVIEKIPHHNPKDPKTAGLISDAVIERGNMLLGEEECRKIRQMIGGLGGGIDDPNFEPLVKPFSHAQFFERENAVFSSKLNYFIDLLNSAEPAQIMTLMRLRLGLPCECS